MPILRQNQRIALAEKGPVDNLLPEGRKNRVEQTQTQVEPDIGPGQVEQILPVEEAYVSQH